MGIEPTAPHGPKEAVFPDGGAESGAFSGVDLELVAVIQAWAELPESVKTAVMEMVYQGSVRDPRNG